MEEVSGLMNVDGMVKHSNLFRNISVVPVLDSWDVVRHSNQKCGLGERKSLGHRLFQKGVFDFSILSKVSGRVA